MTSRCQVEDHAGVSLCSCLPGLVPAVDNAPYHARRPPDRRDLAQLTNEWYPYTVTKYLGFIKVLF